MSRGEHSNHPGHDARCPCKIKINPHPTGMGSRGYACWYTGGHCLPDEECEERVQDYQNKYPEEDNT